MIAPKHITDNTYNNKSLDNILQQTWKFIHHKIYIIFFLMILARDEKVVLLPSVVNYSSGSIQINMCCTDLLQVY